MQRLTEVTAENTAAPALMQGHTNEDSDMMHRMQPILQARRAARNGNGRQNEHEHGNGRQNKQIIKYYPCPGSG